MCFGEKRGEKRVLLIGNTNIAPFDIFAIIAKISNGTLAVWKNIGGIEVEQCKMFEEQIQADEQGTKY